MTSRSLLRSIAHEIQRAFHVRRVVLYDDGESYWIGTRKNPNDQITWLGVGDAPTDAKRDAFLRAGKSPFGNSDTLPFWKSQL